MTGFLDTKLQPFEVRMTRDQSRVAVRGLVVLIQADADAQKKPLSQLSKEMGDAVTQLSQRRQLEIGNQ